MLRGHDVMPAEDATLPPRAHHAGDDLLPDAQRARRRRVRAALDDGSLAEPLDPFDRLIEVLLVALLTYMPFAFGAVSAFSEMIVFLGAGAMGLCLLLKLVVRRNTPFVKSWIFAPVLALVLLVGLQLIPLPAAAVAQLSPQTAQLKTDLLSDLPDAPDLLGSMTLSLYPAATRAGLRMLLAAGVIMVVVANVFRTPRQIRRLLTAIVVIGGGVGVLAVLQSLSGTSTIFWKLDAGGLARGGPFINRNNFCQFMNLSLGAAIGLLLLRLDELGLGRRSLQGLRARLKESDLRVVKMLAAVVVIGAVGIFLSGSRGGTLALLAAFFVTTLLAGTRRNRSALGWVLLVLALLALCGVLYAGFDVAYSRLATLRNLEEASGDRFVMNRDVLAMVPQFPLLGIGFNAHEAVYPMFSRLQTLDVSGNLENEYLQLIEETGLVGLGLLLAFLGLLVRLFVRVLARQQVALHVAGFGFAFAVVAVLVHSMSDFGLRIPAIGCLAAVMVGLLISTSRLGDARPAVTPGRMSRFLRGAALVAGAVVFAVQATSASNAAVAESHWDQVAWVASDLEAKDWQGSDAEFADLIRAAAAAADRASDNAKYRRDLNVYRWRAMARHMVGPDGELIIPDRAAEFTGRIVEELNLARLLCPTAGETFAVTGQLELLVLNRPEGAQHIRTGFKLAPTDPTAAFVAGRLDAREGRWAEASEKFQRAAKLGWRRQEIIDIYVAGDRPELALEVIQGDAGALDSLAKALESSGRHPEVARQARALHRALVRERAAAADAAPGDLAAAAALLAGEGDHLGAADLYRRALDQDYGNVGWRLGLARALAAAGQVPQAMEQARICLRLRPQHPGATRLVEELSVRKWKRAP